jgi:hypothetical protein
MGLLLILGPSKNAHSYPVKEIPPGIQDFSCTMDPLKSGLLMISIPVFMNCFTSQFSKPSYCSNRNNKHP